MTITEHLEFSVLSAPIATIDRRALSQAWYSALYSRRRPAAEAKPAPPNAPACPIAAHPSVQSAHELPRAATQARRLYARLADESEQYAAPRDERRAPRSALARKIEQRFLHPRNPVRSGSFTIDAEYGRVRIVLQGGGSRFKLIAICPAKAKAHVAAALAQARYALALRGIDLDAQTRGASSC